MRAAGALLLAALGLTLAGPTRAASPEVAADGSLIATDLREAAGAWLDRPLPRDAPAGSAIELGVTLSDPISALTPRVFGLLTFRMAPVTGDGQPVEATASSDWEGHYATRLSVPPGGLGELSVGVEIRICAAGGACDRFDGPLSIVGVGPPPGMLLTQIATATIQSPIDPVIAGRPFTLEIELSPKADWEPGTFSFPDTLDLDVREPRGPSVAMAEATLVDAEGGMYRAEVTLPEAGRYVLQVVAPEGGPFATGVLSIAAEAEAALPEPSAGLEPIVVVGAALAVTAVLGLGLYLLRRAG